MEKTKTAIRKARRGTMKRHKRRFPVWAFATWFCLVLGMAVGFSPPPPPPPPNAPSNLQVTEVGVDFISLSWTDNSTDETEFWFFRKTGAGGSWIIIARLDANTTSYTDTGRSPSTTYFYRVRAYNSVDDSTDSNEVNATTLSLDPPINLLAVPLTHNAVGLKWKDNTGNEGGYRIERKGGASGSTFVELATVGIDVVEFQDNLFVDPSTTYTYRVQAFTSTANSSYSNEAGAATPGAPPACGTEGTAGG